MKRKTYLVTLMVLLVGLSCVTWAQAQRGPGRGLARRMPAPRVTAMEPCALHCGMATALMHRSLAATQDGGVLVLAGNTLMRYDSNLALTKTVTLSIDDETSQKQVQALMDKCPVCMHYRERTEPEPDEDSDR